MRESLRNKLSNDIRILFHKYGQTPDLKAIDGILPKKEKDLPPPQPVSADPEKVKKKAERAKNIEIKETQFKTRSGVSKVVPAPSSEEKPKKKRGRPFKKKKEE